MRSQRGEWDELLGCDAECHHSRRLKPNAFKDSILIITFLDVGRELRNWPEPRRDNDKYPGNMQNSGMESANILRSADILSAVGGGTFCHPSSAKRHDGQYVRHPAARRMHALRQAKSLKALGFLASAP